MAANLRSLGVLGSAFFSTAVEGLAGLDLNGFVPFLDPPADWSLPGLDLTGSRFRFLDPLASSMAAIAVLQRLLRLNPQLGERAGFLSSDRGFWEKGGN